MRKKKEKKRKREGRKRKKEKHFLSPLSLPPLFSLLTKSLAFSLYFLSLEFSLSRRFLSIDRFLSLEIIFLKLASKNFLLIILIKLSEKFNLKWGFDLKFI